MRAHDAVSELKLKARALTRSAFRQASATILAAALLPAATLITTNASAVAIPCNGVHCTDGLFTSPAEWNVSRPTVSKSVFAQVGNAGGAALYAEQSGGILHLMYDYFAPSNFGPSSFFDVFFQVKNEDYLVRITPSGIAPNNVWVKPAGTPSNTNPDGSFDTGTPWVLLITEDPAEFNLAQFFGAIGQGASPNNAANHPMAEFQLTIDQTAFANPPPGAKDGIYDPSPAFWGASTGCPQTKPDCADPPISSAIFVLNPDGTTFVGQVLDSNGAPIMQGNVVQAPEPGSMALLGLGLAALVGTWRRRLRG